MLGKGLSREFPNPERVGCPDSAILRGIASHKLPLAQAEPWLEHLGSCSPCFQDFTEFRKQSSKQRRPMQFWLAAAAVLLIAVGGWLWVRTRPSVQSTETAVLDLRGRSVVRGQSPPDVNRHPLEVPRTTKHLILDLPIGSREGNYDIALFNEAGSESLRVSGTAILENHTVVLRADFDPRSVLPGPYFLGLRQPGLEWTRFPARVF